MISVSTTSDPHASSFFALLRLFIACAISTKNIDRKKDYMRGEVIGQVRTYVPSRFTVEVAFQRGNDLLLSTNVRSKIGDAIFDVHVERFANHFVLVFTGD